MLGKIGSEQFGQLDMSMMHRRSAIAHLMMCLGCWANFSWNIHRCKNDPPLSSLVDCVNCSIPLI